MMCAEIHKQIVTTVADVTLHAKTEQFAVVENVEKIVVMNSIFAMERVEILRLILSTVEGAETVVQ